MNLSKDSTVSFTLWEDWPRPKKQDSAVKEEAEEAADAADDADDAKQDHEKENEHKHHGVHHGYGKDTFLRFRDL